MKVGWRRFWMTTYLDGSGAVVAYVTAKVTSNGRTGARIWRNV